MPYLHHVSWSNYIQLLYREISLDEILENEIKNRNIFFNNGLSGIYFLLHSINSNFPDYSIPFDPVMIYDKIHNSDAWNAMLERIYFYKSHRGLVKGFPGVQLVLSHIRDNYKLRIKN